MGASVVIIGITFVVGVVQAVAAQVCADWCKGKVHAEEQERERLQKEKKKHTGFCKEFKNLRTTEQCRKIFDTIFLKECLESLRKVQRDYIRKIRGLDGGGDDQSCSPCCGRRQHPRLEISPQEAKETWAEEWANALYENKTWAKFYEEDKNTVLKFLFHVCDLCFDKNGKVDSEQEFLVNFRERIHAIMASCVVMERAYALYYQENAAGERGRHWYSDCHEGRMKRMRKTNPYGGPMNKRFLWLMDFFKEDDLFRNDEMLKAWLEPKAKS